MDGNASVGGMKRAELFQMVLAGAVLLGCLALPRPGGAVLLIRVPGSLAAPGMLCASSLPTTPQI